MASTCDTATCDTTAPFASSGCTANSVLPSLHHSAVPHLHSAHSRTPTATTGATTTKGTAAPAPRNRADGAMHPNSGPLSARSFTETLTAVTRSGHISTRSSFNTDNTTVNTRAAPSLPPVREPALSMAYLTAQMPFHAAVEVPLDRDAREWNAEFQWLWEEQLHGEVWGHKSHDAIREFLLEFEATAKDLVEALVREGRLPLAPPRGQGANTAGCWSRHGNLLVHVWPDGKLGAWMQRSMRALLGCYVPHLSLPLMATFRCFSDVITVATALPLERSRPPAYAGNGRSDPIVTTPLQELLDMAQDALSILRPDAASGDAAPQPPPPPPAAAAAAAPAAGGNTTDGVAAQPPPPQRKLKGVKVREGLDARLYVVSCIGLLPPLFSSTGRVLSLRRWLYLTQHPPQPWMGGRGAEAYRRDAAAAATLIGAALEAAPERRNAVLVKLLHDAGLNVCLLAMVAQSLLAAAKEDVDDTTEQLLCLVAVEVLARAVRRSLFSAVEREGRARTVKAANEFLARTAGSLLRSSPERFEDGLLPIIRGMFRFDDVADVGPCEQLLRRTLRREVVPITKRLCELCGLRVVRGAVAEVLCQPSPHNYSSLYGAEHQALLTTLALDATDYPPAFTKAFLLPLRVRHLSRGGRHDEAWRAAMLLVQERGRHMEDRFLNAEAWTTAALIAAHAGRTAESAILIERATRVFFDVPAFYFQTSALQVRVPPYLYFLRGQVHVKLAHGFISVKRRLLETAEELFSEALRLPDVLGPAQQPMLAHFRQQAVLGLLSIAVRSEKAKVKQLDAQWSAEIGTMAPSLQGARISELFGSLFFDRDMFPCAVARLWECLETTEQLLGATAFRVGEVLNKLAYVYYRWDVRQYGLFCCCILHRAEDIMVEQCGLYSPMHLSIAENIAAVFIERGMFVEASQRLHQLRTLPPRYTGRISREHPTMVRIAAIEVRLREEFTGAAIVIIQRYWREYRSRALLRDVYETNAREVQRLGRGYLVRRRLLQVYDGWTTAEEVATTAQLYLARTFARPLLCATALFEKEQRHWNAELQNPRLFGVWWEQVEQQVRRDESHRFETEFKTAAGECLHGMRSGALRATPVPGCATSVVMQNMVFTQVPVDDRLSALQVCVSRHLSSHAESPITTPLRTLVELDGSAYYVEALIPLHHHPHYVFTAGGHSGDAQYTIAHALVDALLSTYRAAGLTQYTVDNVQAVEVVRGADGMLYLTNALGLVMSLVQTPGPLDVATVELPPSLFSNVWELLHAGKPRDTMEVLERAVLSQASADCTSMSIFVLSQLASARLLCGDDVEGATRLLQRCSREMEEIGDDFAAAVLSFWEGRAWISRGSAPAARGPLLRALDIFTGRVRLHAYYGAYCIFETARWVLRATVVWETKVDAAVLRCVVHAVEYGEPTLMLFTTCSRFIVYTQKVGDASVTQRLTQLRDQRARELRPSELDRYLHFLLDRSENLQRCGGNESYNDCVFVLQTAIHMAEAAATESRMLGVLLTSYGLLLTSMSKLKEARRALARANAVLLRTVTQSSPEAMTWRKNHRTLRYRLRENAVGVIRRAVRLWKERRRREREMRVTDPTAYHALMAVRYQQRMKSLVVCEATARVLIADACGDEHYQLMKRQRRMRNAAMLKQTYGSRVQLFLDKIDCALAAVAELAMETKGAMAQAAWDIRQSLLTAFLSAGHRIERRGVIGEWRASLVTVKLWHIEQVDLAIRAEFFTVLNAFVRRCMAAEEQAWRRVVVRNQKRSKRELGNAINRAMRRKSKQATVDVRALLLNETRRREDILLAEEAGYRTLMHVFTFGPEVEDDEVMELDTPP